MQNKNIIHLLHNQTPEQMMSFIIQTDDGKLIVIDGGTEGDAEYLLENLRSISGAERPVVDAWFLTHAHSDHINAFLKIVGMKDAVRVGKLYYNFTSRQFMHRNEPMFAEEIDAFYDKLPLFAGCAEIISTGDCYQVGSAKFDVLLTPDSRMCQNAGNNASSVLRMTLAGQTVLFLGDLGVEGGEKLLEMYGGGLKSDFCQLAHHGQSGVERDVYEAVSPKGCFWCTPQWLWDNDNGGGYNTFIWKTLQVRQWVQEIGVRENYVIKDGSCHVELPHAFG